MEFIGFPHHPLPLAVVQKAGPQVMRVGKLALLLSNYTLYGLAWGRVGELVMVEWVWQSGHADQVS